MILKQTSLSNIISCQGILIYLYECMNLSLYVKHIICKLYFYSLVCSYSFTEHLYCARPLIDSMNVIIQYSRCWCLKRPYSGICITHCSHSSLLKCKQRHKVTKTTEKMLTKNMKLLLWVNILKSVLFLLQNWVIISNFINIWKI